MGSWYIYDCKNLFSAFIGGGILSDTTDLALQSACIITIIVMLSGIDVLRVTLL
jgi:hypothetical protein